jgi:hypothetical protein
MSQAGRLFQANATIGDVPALFSQEARQSKRQSAEGYA